MSIFIISLIESEYCGLYFFNKQIIICNDYQSFTFAPDF